ncbi:MAG TPA: BREX system ATP-binding domain-containing protein [Candidatus Bathyarchaeia archaeon]|nr:BREX system ATP-binding domain-containing protein [Candidatus Bathyarchaeia archaeon]
MNGQQSQHGPPLDLRQLQPRDYSRFFFIENPFPAIAVAEENPTVFVDRESIMRLIRDSIVSSVSTDKSQTVVLQGVYGSGKSHILKYVKATINSQLSTRPQGKALAVYVESPRSSFRDFFSGIISGLGVAVMKELAATLISDYVLRTKEDLQSYILKTSSGPSGQEIAKRLRTNPAYLGDIVEHLRYLDLFHVVKKAHERTLKVRDFLTVLLQLLVPGNETASWRWLLGEPLLREERDRLGISYGIEEDNVLDVTGDLLSIYRMSGYRTLFVLLDELEDLVDLHATRRSRYFSDLRHFIDRNTQGVCLIACVTPTGFSEIRASGHPLERRLLSVNDILHKFDVSRTVDLVIAYLGASRHKFFEKKGGHDEFLKRIPSLGSALEPTLFPFTRSVVTKICERGDGNVGNILSICHRLVDRACDENLNAILDGDLVERVLEEG